MTRTKCTYEDDTPRLKDIEDEKLSVDWSEHIAAIHCAAWSAFTVHDRHNSADRLRPLRQVQWLQWVWWPQSTSIMDNQGRNWQIKSQDPSTTEEARTFGGTGTHDDSGRKSNGKMQPVQALIDCGASSIFMTVRLLKWLRISYQAVHIITLAMTGGVMQYAKDSRTMRITVRYLNYLTLVDRSDIVVVAMRAYN